MLGPEPLADPERFLVERFGSGLVLHLLEKEPEVTQGIRSHRVLQTRGALCRFERPFRNGDGLLILSLLNQLAHLLIERGWIIVFDRRRRACENPEA